MAEQSIEPQVRTIIRMLMVRDGLRDRTLSEKLGMSRASLNDRLRGRSRFTIDDLAHLADIFDVDPGIFFQDPRVVLAGTGSVHPSAPDLLTCTFPQLPWSGRLGRDPAWQIVRPALRSLCVSPNIPRFPTPTGRAA